MILRVKNLTKSFGGVKALNKTTFTVKQGTITALIGPNGSGKSTCFNIISRLLKEEKGSISLLKQDITKKRAYQVALAGISRTFQHVRLFSNLTIEEHFDIVLNQHNTSLFKSFFLGKKSNEKIIKEKLQLVGLNKPLTTYATDLSYGQRKLLDLALALAKPHSLLLLDEPVAGVNPLLRKELKKILKKLNKHGETILVIEHDMNFIMDLADDIYVLDQGAVIAQGPPKKIQKNKKVLLAYLGE